MDEEEKERLIKKDIASIENRVRHAFNQGYEMGLKERKNICEDAVSRQSAIFLASDLKQDLPDDERISDMVMAHNEGILEYQTQLSLLPSVNPQYTDAEIQKMQDLEQAEIQKAYELGKAAQPKTGHWIPVSERLPEPYQNILVTAEDLHFEYEPVKYSVYQKSFNGHVNFIAWMPLPEPYEPEESEVRDADSD